MAPNNTQTPPPPLPFGGPAGLPKASINKAIGVGDLTAFQQAADLVGQRIYDKLTIKGEVGANPFDLSLPRMGDSADYSARQPFVLTCQRWMELDAPHYLICKVNPGEIQWKMPQRSATQKTRIGEILHIWKDRFRGTFYNEPELTITFQSGNIMPIRQKPLVTSKENKRKAQTVLFSDVNDEGVVENQTQWEEVSGPENDTSEEFPQVPGGLNNFYEFLALVDEQKIITDGPSKGKINYVYMMYNSRIFPNMTLVGLFTPDGVSWTDAANDPNQITNWTANFTVYDSYPRLNDLSALNTFFQDAGFGRI
jgi:hypothetical protein